LVNSAQPLSNSSSGVSDLKLIQIVLEQIDPQVYSISLLPLVLGIPPQFGGLMVQRLIVALLALAGES
jgi:hypothetical protein